MKNKLNDFAANNNSTLSKRKTVKKGSLDDLDKTLFLWFSQKQAESVPIFGPMLVQKAKFCSDALGFSVNFNASSGWQHWF